MFTIILTVLSCAVLYAIKGGSGNVFKNWDRVREKNKVLDRLLDGKVLSTILMLVLAYVGTGEPLLALSLAVAWLAAVAPSMGEEHGAVGDNVEAWGPYIDKGFGRSYGVKKAVQRGVICGAVFTLVVPGTAFLLASLLFVPCVYAGQCLNRIVLKKRGWTLAEPLIGGLVIGLPLGLYFAGVELPSLSVLW